MIFRADPPPPRLDLDWTGALRQIVSTESYLASTVRPDSTPQYPWWHPYVRDGRFYAAEGGAARAVFAVEARNIFGFGKAKGFTATRWSIDSEPA